MGTLAQRLGATSGKVPRKCLRHRQQTSALSPFHAAHVHARLTDTLTVSHMGGMGHPVDFRVILGSVENGN
jgi:hypothetical protein